jgi:threonine/homoserine/homoserine lactone efflux protein
LEIFLLKGLVIGILFGIPIGAVGAVTVQRTLAHGSWAGIVSGMGSSVADYLYACVGAFGLTFISDFLLENQTIINILGGTMILLMGIKMLVKQSETTAAKPNAAGAAKMFLSSFVVGVTNPAAVLTFLFAFSYFGISGQMGFVDGIRLVSGIFIGTLLWWVALAAIVGVLKNKIVEHGFKNINKVFGVILLLFSVAIFIRTIQS